MAKMYGAKQIILWLLYMFPLGHELLWISTRRVIVRQVNDETGAVKNYHISYRVKHYNG